MCLRACVCVLRILEASELSSNFFLYFPPLCVCVGCMLWTVGCMKILEASALSANLRRLSLARNDAGTPAAYVVARLLKSEWGVRVGGREGGGRESGGRREGGSEGGRERGRDR